MTTIYRLSLLAARSLAAAAVGFLAMWAIVLASLAIFGGSLASFVLETAGTIQAVLASQILLMGVPLSWSMPAFHVHATVTPMALLQDTPALLLGGLVPLGGSIVAGLVASWWSRHLGYSRVVALGATAILSALCAAIAATGLNFMPASAQAIRFEAAPMVVGAMALPWAIVGGLLGAWLDSGLLTLRQPRIERPAHWYRPRRRSVTWASLAFAISNVVPTIIPSAAAASAMNSSTLPLSVATRPAVLSALHQLDREANSSSSAVVDPLKGTASFVRPHSALGSDERTWLQNHSGLFGVQDLAHSLTQTRKERDSLGATHAYFDQTYGGVPVYGATVSVHTGRDAAVVDAVSSSLVPDVPPLATNPLLTADAALSAAQRALPDGELVEQPTLYVYVHSGVGSAGASATRQSSLVWLVWLAATAHDVSKAYFVDTGSSAGTILHTEDKAQTAAPAGSLPKAPERVVPAAANPQNGPSHSPYNATAHAMLTAQQKSPSQGMSATGQRSVAVPDPDPSHSNNVSYHGGKVLHSTTNYLIWWLPTNQPQPTAHYRAIIRRYFRDVSNSNLYGVMGQYTDGNGAPSATAMLGGEWTDTGSYPSGKGSQTNPLTDTDIRDEVNKALTANLPTWQLGDDHVIYYVFLAAGVEECSSGFTPSTCTFFGPSPPANPNQAFCAYHSSYFSVNRLNGINYAVMPYANSPGRFCDFSAPPHGSPNQDPDADQEVNILSHEFFETVTDAHGDGWNDPNSLSDPTIFAGSEIGDKCNFRPGPLHADQSDVHLNGNPYLVQEEWSNSAHNCVLPDVSAPGPKNRLVYDLNHGMANPGTLARAEGQGVSPVADVNAAYDNTGSTYDYYMATFARNSYDSQGARLISSVRYGTNYMNAYWNGIQMVYGDGNATVDITGHELTHAVTGATAALTYQNQSGALNESFSDIFGEMVELYVLGTNDWLIGEGSALGVIRSMQDPTLYNQPDNLHNYQTVCSDNGGVHTNSGIQNKAFYNIAQTIGSNKAAAVFYRTLTFYLSTSASFEDSRAATITAANDLYNDPNVTQGVIAGWNAVGVDGSYQGPAQSCGGGSGGCFAQAALNSGGLAGLNAAGPAPADILATLYEIRDEVAPSSLAGSHYLGVWDRNTAEAAQLVVSNKSVRMQAAHVFQAMTPGLRALASGNGRRVVVSKHLVNEINDLLDSLTIADRGGSLATALNRERARVDFTRLEGHNFADAVKNVSAQLKAAGVSVASGS